MAFELLYTRVFHHITNFPDELIRLLNFASTYKEGDEMIEINVGYDVGYDSKLHFVASRINPEFNDGNFKHINNIKVDIYVGDGSSKHSFKRSINFGSSFQLHVYGEAEAEKEAFRLYTFLHSSVCYDLVDNESRWNNASNHQQWWSNGKISSGKIVHRDQISRHDEKLRLYEIYSFISRALGTQVFVNIRRYLAKLLDVPYVDTFNRFEQNMYEWAYILFEVNMLRAAAIYLDIMSAGHDWYDRLKKIHANPNVMREEAINSVLEKVHNEQIHHTWLANALLVVYFIRSFKPVRQGFVLHEKQSRSALNIAYRLMFTTRNSILNTELYSVMLGGNDAYRSFYVLYALYSKETLNVLLGKEEPVGAAAEGASGAAVEDAITLPSDLNADADYKLSTKSNFEEESEQINTAKDEYNAKYTQYQQRVEELKEAASAYAAAIKAQDIDKHNSLAKSVARIKKIKESLIDHTTIMEWPDIVMALREYVVAKGKAWSWPQGGSDEVVLRAIHTLLLTVDTVESDERGAKYMSLRIPHYTMDDFQQQRNELCTVLFEQSAEGLAESARTLKDVCINNNIQAYHMLPIITVIKEGGAWWDRIEATKYIRMVSLRCASCTVVSVVALHPWGGVKFYSPREAVDACTQMDLTPNGRLYAQIVRHNERHPDTDPAVEGRLLFECITDGNRSVLEPFVAAFPSVVASRLWVRGVTFPMFKAISRSRRIAIDGDAHDFTLSLDSTTTTHFRCTNFFGPNVEISFIPVVKSEGTTKSYIERYTEQFLDAHDARGVQHRIGHNIVTSVGDATIDSVVEKFLSTHVLTHTRQSEISRLIHRRPHDDPLWYNCLLWWWLQERSNNTPPSIANAVISGMLSFKLAVQKFRKEKATDAAARARLSARLAAIPGISESKLEILGIATPLLANNLYTQAPIHEDCEEEEEEEDPNTHDLLLDCVLKASPFTQHTRAANKAKAVRLNEEDVVARKRMRIS